MQGLYRNKRKIFYALYEGDEEIVSEDGTPTGRYRAKYGKPVPLMVNYSNTVGLTNNNISGKVARNLYGQTLDYNVTINPLPDGCPIDEMSVLWIDTEPVLNADGSTDTPPDHVITRISGALNWRACQAAKVTRSSGGAG